MTYFIYKITNNINRKCYIGKTSRKPDVRFNEHRWSARNGGKSLLYKAMRKHGVDNFSFEVIDDSADTTQQLNILEKEYIKIFDCCYLDGSEKGYNLTRGGDGFDSESASIMNAERVNNGTHHFLDPYWSSKRSKHANERVAEGTHNFLGGELQRSRLEAGTHNLQGAKASRVVSERNNAMVANGTHPWVGEEHSKRMRELANTKLADGTHNSQTERICPYCNKTGKGPGMLRWHFDNCKFKENI